MMLAEFCQQMLISNQNQSPWFWGNNHGDWSRSVARIKTTLGYFLKIQASETVRRKLSGMEKFEVHFYDSYCLKRLWITEFWTKERSYEGNSWKIFLISSDFSFLTETIIHDLTYELHHSQVKNEKDSSSPASEEKLSFPKDLSIRDKWIKRTKILS